MPFVRDSATFSAASRHTEARRKSVSPSFHSLDCRSKVRGVDAIVKFATAEPYGVKRGSGSFVRLPITVIWVSPAIYLAPAWANHAASASDCSPSSTSSPVTVLASGSG